MSGPGVLSMDDTLRRMKTWEFAQRVGVRSVPIRVDTCRSFSVCRTRSSPSPAIIISER